MIKNKVFYMVYVDGNCSPSYKHLDLSSAMLEAERLCAKEGRKCYVLKSIHGYEPIPKPFHIFSEEN